MTWNTKYWDMVEQLYWTPSYVGMGSITRKHWERRDGMVCIPEEMVNQTGSLYTRERKIHDLKADLHGKEEILNHIFDLTFAIAPDSLISEVFLDPLGFSDSGPFDSVGRETAARYGWSASENITQQDGLFVSRKSAVAVEIKLGTSSSAEQIAKYAALLAWEELRHGSRPQLGLLFVVPAAALGDHWRKCGLEGPKIDSTFLTGEWKGGLPKAIIKLFHAHPELVASVLDRLRLAAISWAELRDRLMRIRASLDPKQRGEQTLAKLIDGFLAQLDSHRGTGLDAQNAS